MAYLNLSNIDHFQILNTKVERRQAAIHIIDFNISALTLNPTTGHLWVSDHTDGGIFSCSINGTCEVVVDAIITGIYDSLPLIKVMHACMYMYACL